MFCIVQLCLCFCFCGFCAALANKRRLFIITFITLMFFQHKKLSFRPIGYCGPQLGLSCLEMATVFNWTGKSVNKGKGKGIYIAHFL